MNNWGIILAGGAGTRMGAPKAFLLLDEKPMLWYSLLAFENATEIDRIGIVCRKEDQEQVNGFVNSSSTKKIEFIVPGGKERQDSVYEGINALPKNAAVVAIHDAARPLITPEIIDDVMSQAEIHGAALAAIPTKDTIKISEDNVVQQTLDRKKLWAAQTPQAIRYELFVKAFQKAKQDQFYGTDCTSLIERLNHPVHLVMGSPENIKVTTSHDIIMAEAILRQRIHV